MKKLYVGNLSFSTGESELKAAFEAHGTVHSAAVIMDRETNQSRGFGFVEMDDAEADIATTKMNGADLDGRELKVNEAKARN